MPSDSHEQQQPPSVSDTKANGESQPSLTSDRVRAGTKVVMSHAERQAFLKTSPLGQLLGVAHLLPEVEEAKDAALKKSSLENPPTLISNEKIFRQITVVKGSGDFKRSKEAERFTQKSRSRLQTPSPLEVVWRKFRWREEQVREA